MQEAQVSIEPARPADSELILELIRELAAFEKLEHEVVGTVDELEESLFGERPAAEVLLCRVDGEAAGFALFFHNYSTFLCRRGLYLEDLYVRPAFRSLGLGTRLLRHLAGVALERDCGRLEWWVLDWNERAVRFYEGLGAQAMRDWTVYRLSGDALTRVARGPR